MLSIFDIFDALHYKLQHLNICHTLYFYDGIDHLQNMQTANSNISRDWKIQLQSVAAETGLQIKLLSALTVDCGPLPPRDMILTVIKYVKKLLKVNKYADTAHDRKELFKSAAAAKFRELGCADYYEQTPLPMSIELYIRDKTGSDKGGIAVFNERIKIDMAQRKISKRNIIELYEKRWIKYKYMYHTGTKIEKKLLFDLK